jgi:SAM-dependent methyltransferase
MFQGALDAVEPLKGKRLFDSGCGAGLALQLAAQRGAQVSGVDATPELVAIAKERTPHADVRVGDIESLPFDDQSFDVSTAFNSMQYATDPMAALRELARVTKRSGRIVIGQWGEVGRCETEKFFQALRALAPPPPGTPAPLALSGDGILERRLVEAGMRPIAWGEANCPFTYSDIETAWRANVSAGPLVRVIGVAGEDAVRAVFTKCWQPCAQPDGTVTQKNVFRWVVSEL